MANQEDFIRFNLRLPPELNEALDRAAEEHRSSKNAEIIRRLEDSFKAAPALPGQVDLATVERLMDMAADKVLKKAIQALAAGLEKNQ